MYELKCEQIGLYSVLQMGREDLEALLWRHFQYDPWQQAELLLFIDRLCHFCALTPRGRSVSANPSVPSSAPDRAGCHRAHTLSRHNASLCV